MAERRLVGRSAAPGLAQGVVQVLEAPRPAGRAAGTCEEERAALLTAIAGARAETTALAAAATGEAADMLAFQAAMLDDEELWRPVLCAIEAGTPVLAAWEGAMAEEAASYAASSDPAFAARATDLDDIRDRVLAHLSPGPAPAEAFPGAVIAAADLTLSRFLSIDWLNGGAIVLTRGSPAGHVAMLARARGVPMVVGVGGAAQALTGHEALVDAAAGEVVLDPDEATRAAFAARMGEAAAARGRADRFRAGLAYTADGTRIAVHLNVGDATDLDGLDPIICDGIGLVRTELLFHDGAGVLPDEDAQYAAYRRVADWAAGRPVVIRTLDAGGDKPIPGVTPDGESNPFLGLRGLRLSLCSPGLFRMQLRALARAAAHGDVRVMLPMVTVPEEVQAVRALVEAVLAELVEEGIRAARPRLGIMVEVPAAAICVERFEAEFFSIGSNDLTQYVTAAGRDIGSVAGLADPLNPAVLRLIEAVTRHGRMVGCEVSLCGDAAADPRCVGPLLRAGLRSLSVPPAAVGRTKEAIAAVDLAEAAP